MEAELQICYEMTSPWSRRWGRGSAFSHRLRLPSRALLQDAGGSGSPYKPESLPCVMSASWTIMFSYSYKKLQPYLQNKHKQFNCYWRLSSRPYLVMKVAFQYAKSFTSPELVWAVVGKWRSEPKRMKESKSKKEPGLFAAAWCTNWAGLNEFFNRELQVSVTGCWLRF